MDLSLRLQCRTIISSISIQSQVLVEQLKAIGVTAKIQQVEWDSWLSDVYADRKFQSTVVGVDAAYLSGRALLERFTSTSSKNFINYSNEEYDKLYQQVKTSTDEEEQVELYKKNGNTAL